MAVGCMFAPVLAFGQSSDSRVSPRNETKIQMKIIHEENGLSSVLDTSFNNLDEAQAAVKLYTKKKKQPEQVVQGDQMIELFLNQDCDEEGGSLKKKKKIMFLGPDQSADEVTKALRSLEEFQFDLPEMKVFHHGWAMNGNRNFSIQVTDADKEELNKLGVKPGNAEEYLEDLMVSGSSSKNKLKLTFEVFEPVNLVVKVLSQEGKEIYSQSHTRYIGLFNNAIDLGRRIKGTVFLVVSANGRSLVKKISRGNTTND